MGSSSQAGIVLISLSSLFFSLMTFCVRMLPDISTWEAVFLRSSFNALLFLPWFYFSGKKNNWYKETLKNDLLTLFLRGFFGGSAMILFYYAIKYLPLGIATLLNYLSPLWVIVLARIILREKLGPVASIWVFIAFIGVSFILYPSKTNTSKFEWFGLPTLLGFISSILAASAYLSIKIATNRKIPSNLIVLTFSLVAMMLSTFPAIQHWKSPNYQEWIWLILLGLSASLAQLCMTKGYSKISASVASPLQFLAPVYSTTLGILFLNEVPNKFHILGAILVVLGLTFATKYKKL